MDREEMLAMDALAFTTKVHHLLEPPLLKLQNKLCIMLSQALLIPTLGLQVVMDCLILKVPIKRSKRQ